MKALGVIALGVLAGTASANFYSYEFQIDGLQEVPAVVTPAFGTGVVTLDTGTNELTWNISWQDLIGTVSNAHFHGPAVPGVNAGVRIGLDFTQNPMVGSTTISSAFASEIIAGLWYVNIHSTHRPGGEIRGQVVPAPASAALLGLGGLMATRRRRA
jgi:hypothetical protein